VVKLYWLHKFVVSSLSVVEPMSLAETNSSYGVDDQQACPPTRQEVVDVSRPGAAWSDERHSVAVKGEFFDPRIVTWQFGRKQTAAACALIVDYN